MAGCFRFFTSSQLSLRRMGLEGIVSKRVDAPYCSGPSKVSLKSKTASAAVRRVREEEWR